MANINIRGNLNGELIQKHNYEFLSNSYFSEIVMDAGQKKGVETDREGNRSNG